MINILKTGIVKFAIILLCIVFVRTQSIAANISTQNSAILFGNKWPPNTSLQTAPPTKKYHSEPPTKPPSTENTITQSLNATLSSAAAVIAKQPGSVNTSSHNRFCGVPDDPQRSSLHHRVKRYRLEGTKWPNLEITWAIVVDSRSQGISKYEIVTNLKQAFKLWSDVSKLTFREVNPSTPKIDIAIGFHTKDHGDRYPFDGPGKTLAHAFYPGSGGDVHFDDSENFKDHHESIKSGGTSFLVTAAHELGHSLGLHHSNNYSALMAPIYQSYPETFVLPDDDTRAIRALYGASDEGFTPITYRPVTPTRTTRRTTTSTTTTTTTPRTTRRTTLTPKTTKKTTPFYYFPTDEFTRPRTTTTESTTTTTTTSTTTTTTTAATTTTTTTPSFTVRIAPVDVPPSHMPLTPTCQPKATDLARPDTCSTPFDAVTYFRREVYFFKEKFLWRVPMAYDYYPIAVDRLFEALAEVSHIDAAYETTDSTSFVIFSDNLYYKIKIEARGESVEKGTLMDLGINASRVDAAMIWGHNGHVYIFSGGLYWRLDDHNRAGADYPRHMGVWGGVPHNISAAVTVQDKTYFFSGQMFWPFDNFKMRVEEPPRLTAAYWLDCPHADVEERGLCSTARPVRACTSLAICCTAAAVVVNMYWIGKDWLQ